IVHVVAAKRLITGCSGDLFISTVVGIAASVNLSGGTRTLGSVGRSVQWTCLNEHRAHDAPKQRLFEGATQGAGNLCFPTTREMVMWSPSPQDKQILNHEMSSVVKTQKKPVPPKGQE
ncbi:unnamed protein product, partial [Ectocarpus sp. 12 AP-2014]